MQKLSTEEFISKCKAIYGDAYDYSTTTYKTSKEPVTIVCRTHGEFSKSPNLLISKRSGCPKCGNARKGLYMKLDRAEVLNDLAAKYPRYAPFKLEAYNRNTDKVEFLCPEHGEQRATVVYLRGLSQETPCSVCNTTTAALKKRLVQEDFIKDCVAKHGSKYDYSKVVYITSQDKITVVCPEHGEFHVEAMTHKLGTGCAKCCFEARKDNILPYSEWLAKARAVHGDRYTYSDQGYAGAWSKVEITCAIHGKFQQVGIYHTSGSGCPSCASIGSKGQTELTEFLESLGVKVLRDYKIGEGRLEVDCYLPEFKLAVEYDGLKWHSTQNRSATHHKRKRDALEAQGIKLMRIFEDEWRTKNKQVKSLLESRLLRTSPALAARNCKIKAVDNETAEEFYNANHVQGWDRAGSHAGLEHEGELVALMTFTQVTSERGEVAQPGHWELVRFASKVRVAGAASRLFSTLVRSTGAKSVVSYSDDRLFTGGMYPALGFKFDSKVAPSYTYWKDGTNHRLHKSHFRHSKLPKLLGERYNPNLTERANCEAAGYYQVYDCGLTKWVWQSTLNL